MPAVRTLFRTSCRFLPVAAALLALLAPALAKEPQPRPPVCEEAMNATNAANATAEATLALWDSCLAEPSLAPGDRAVAQCNKGGALLQMKRAQESLEPLDQCLAAHPRYAPGLALRASARYWLENLRGSAMDISAAISLAPRNLEYRRLRAKLACDLNMCERGLDDLDVIVRLSPDKAEALEMRAWALGMAGQPNRALLDADAALELAPENHRLHADRGRLLFQLGRVEEALAGFEAAVRLKPGEAELLGGRATMREALGRWKPALDDRLAALALAPEKAGALNNLAWLYATCPQESLRNPAEALRLAKASVAKERKAYNLDTLAAALARNGEFGPAALAQEEALALLKKQGGNGAQSLRGAEARLELYRSGKAYAQPMSGRGAGS